MSNYLKQQPCFVSFDDQDFNLDDFYYTQNLIAKELVEEHRRLQQRNNTTQKTFVSTEKDKKMYEFVDSVIKTIN